VLRHDVAGRSLAANDDRARRQVVCLAATNAVVQVDGMQDIQKLPLVFVDALHLHVEQHVALYVDAGLFLQRVREAILVEQLDLAPLALEFGIVREFPQLLQLIEVGHPAVADLAAD
jgi:hypothetical protein